MDAIDVLKRQAIDIIARCSRNIPWDEDDQEEEFQYNLECDPEKAWENLAYYWWAEYKAGADWWCSMAEAAMKLMNDRKTEYAMMRMNHLSVANALACDVGPCQCTPLTGCQQLPGWSQEQQIKTYPFPKFQPQPKDGIAEYLVWMESEYKAGWGLRIWHDLRKDPGEAVSDEAPNGAWSSDAFDAPVLFWAEKPSPPEGHFRKSMGSEETVV